MLVKGTTGPTSASLISAAIPESTFALRCTTGDGDMRHVADAGQGFTTESIRGDALKIFKLLQLAGGESFTHNGKVFFLKTTVSSN